MSILIDTNVFLWAAGITGNLSPEVRALLEEPGGPIFLSAASAWEISIKWAKKRLILPDKPGAFIDKFVSAASFTKLSVNFADACAVAEFKLVNKDPFDRLILAQARNHGLRLLTSDFGLQHPDVDVILCKRKQL